ncbi:hypothetical protein MA16_Dca025169 [Dendrobium catenatum]|uniref:Uncharacterized protein n=1 Tax=Dendrobium catenatum TaxID=906689 RepID=A0A2I0VIF7_9ASPA|nr:hypothetical protein MA16_Dca025169 [Dendrobium catenatum]
MVGGGRRSPPRHPSGRGGGGDSGGLDVRSCVSVRGRNAVDRGGSRADVHSGVGSCERRFSLTGLEGLEEIEADDKRLVYSRVLGTGAVSSIIAGGSQRIDAQEIHSSEELDMGSNAEGGIEAGDRDLSMNDSSDLDEVMEILGGSEAEDFIREVNEGARSLDLIDLIWDTEGLNGATVVSECAVMMDAMEKEEFVSSEGVKVRDETPDAQCTMTIGTEQGDLADLKVEPVVVSKMIDNPVFEPNRIIFTFGNRSHISDLYKALMDGNIQNDKVSLDLLQKFSFVNQVDVKNADHLIRGKNVMAYCNDSPSLVECTPGVWGNASSEALSSKQQAKGVGISRQVKMEVNDIGLASNAWKKSATVQLNLF